MVTAEAQIPTERPSRYLVQLCRHASRLNHLTRSPMHRMPAHIKAEWSESDGMIRAGDATCTLRATPNTLLLRLEAPDNETLLRMQAMITRSLTRFSRREPLAVRWHHSSAQGTQ